MKRWKAAWQRLKNNRKLRCGGFSAALCAGVILLALLLVALADRLESRYALAGDYSFNAATTQSETTAAVLDRLTRDVHIYAVIPQEGENTTLLSLLERYAAASPHVTYTRESIVKNPVLLTQFADAIGENEVSSDCLIVSCRETGRARVLTEDDYYVYSYDTESGYFSQAGFTYEKSITEAILYVTQDELPTLQILTGHGELTEADTANLEDTLISANYLLQRVNLQAGDELDPASPLMLLSPKYDLSDQELEKIWAFARAGGDFFIVSQYSDPLDLENYNALLRAYGIQGYPGLVFAKEEDTASYYADTPVWLMPYLQETDQTASLLSAGKDILLLAGARAFQLPDGEDANLTVTPVLLSGQAYIRNYQDGVSLSEQQETDREGVFPLALWTDKMFEDGTLSHAFVIGNITAFLDYWTMNNTDSTAFLLQMVRSLQGKSPVSLDIMPKNALRAGLSLGNITPAVIAIVLLPLLIALGAALVLLPRRNL